jgi:hypothetical protein
MGEIEMINVLPPPTETEEYQNMAEILRELAAQVRFSKTRNALVNFADTFDRLADLASTHLRRRSKTSLGSTVETAPVSGETPGW